MNSPVRTIVICGATGKQGGAVLDSLQKAGGWNLVALSRDVNGSRAGTIKQRGVEVRYADLDDATSLANAFAGAYGVYGVTTMLTSTGKLDTDVERRQGRQIADACVANRVEHLAFEDPQAFVGRKLTLIGDFISGEELAQVLTRVSGGRPFRHKVPPMWLMWIFAREWTTLRKQFESWGRAPHPKALLDAMAETRHLLPEVLSFEDYLRAIEFEKIES